MVRWVAALVVGAAPRRVWPRLELHMPVARAAAPAGLLAMLAGFFLGVGGFFSYATRVADANNSWMLRTLASGGSDQAAFVPYGMSVVTLFIFLLFTPLGWLSSYLAVSGFLRAVSAWFDDPRGDPLLSLLDAATVRFLERQRQRLAREARERREGAAAPDVLVTGHALGVGADFVVLASRRKDEWTAGATIMTPGQWYRLGEPYDLETPAGLRTAYPLTKFDSLEVVRRGIPYELPALSGRSARAPQRST
ncbi:MAG: hypothetical protein HY048_02305 [Acidobacteria bacterium]|nr:hypothetical protein [Acidobacteriota bacterium]